jgi:alpha-galactosidase
MAANKIVLTIAEEKLANQIISAAKDLRTAYGAFAKLVADFIGPVSTHDGVVARAKILYASKAYKASENQAAIRKAIQRMRNDRFPSTTTGAKRGTQNKTSVKRDMSQKAVTKTVHVLPDWAKDLPPLVIQWAEQHTISAVEALVQAYKRDTSSMLKAA